MKHISKILVSMALILSPAAFAANGLYYSAGEEAGAQVSAATYLGFEEVCFRGQPMNSVKEVWSLLMTDTAAKRPFIRYDKSRDAIIYGYSETHCEEGANCRVVHMAHRCS